MGLDIYCDILFTLTECSISTLSYASWHKIAGQMSTTIAKSAVMRLMDLFSLYIKQKIVLIAQITISVLTIQMFNAFTHAQYLMKNVKLVVGILDGKHF